MLRYAVLSAGGWVWYQLQTCMANFEVLQMLRLLHAFISAYLLARARGFYVFVYIDLEVFVIVYAIQRNKLDSDRQLAF